MSILSGNIKSKISENSDNKADKYSSSKFTKMVFQKKLLLFFFFFVKKGFFLVKKGKYPTKIRAFNFTTVDYPVYWTFKITLSSIGFEWKTVLIC